MPLIVPDLYFFSELSFGNKSYSSSVWMKCIRDYNSTSSNSSVLCGFFLIFSQCYTNMCTHTHICKFYLSMEPLPTYYFETYIPLLSLPASFFFFFWTCLWHWDVSAQGWSLHHSSDQSCGSGNSSSLTTRQLPLPMSDRILATLCEVLSAHFADYRLRFREVTACTQGW